MNSDEVERILALGVEQKLLVKNNGKFTVKNKSLSTKGDWCGRNQILRYWLQRQHEALETNQRPDPQDLSRYILFTTNAKTHAKILELTKRYYQSLFVLLHDDDRRAGSAPLDRVLSLQLYLLNLKNMTKA